VVRLENKKYQMPEATGILLKDNPKPDHANNPPPSSVKNPIRATNQHDSVFNCPICPRI